MRSDENEYLYEPFDITKEREEAQYEPLTVEQIVEVHDKLKAIVKRRGALDAEEAQLLRMLDREQAWKLFGCVNHLDYIERVFGYLPHTGSERLRVARSLASLPKLEAALGEGALPYTAVRELSRVAVTETEDAWRDAAVGKNMRQIEELVTGHEPGDLPTDPPKPEVKHRNLTFVVGPEQMALVRKVRTLLGDETGKRLDDDDFIEALCQAVLDQKAPTEPRTRSKYDIAVTVCRHCDNAQIDAGGVKLDIDEAALARIRCDSRDVGPLQMLDNKAHRAVQTIPPAVYRQIWMRDGGRCSVPGCRSARCVEVHHRKPRSEGGTNDPDNLLLLCSACHRALHLGLLILYGPIGNLTAERPYMEYVAAKRQAAGYRLAQGRTLESEMLERKIRSGQVPRGTKSLKGLYERSEPLPL